MSVYPSVGDLEVPMYGDSKCQNYNVSNIMESFEDAALLYKCDN